MHGKYGMVQNYWKGIDYEETGLLFIGKTVFLVSARQAGFAIGMPETGRKYVVKYAVIGLPNIDPQLVGLRYGLQATHIISPGINFIYERKEHSFTT